jgi:hypothetical protein
VLEKEATQPTEEIVNEVVQPDPFAAALINDTQEAEEKTKKDRGDLLIKVGVTNDKKLLDVAVRHTTQSMVVAIERKHRKAIEEAVKAGKQVTEKDKKIEWAGQVTSFGEEVKIKKYVDKYLINRLDVVPVIYDEFGYLGKIAKEYFKKLAESKTGGILRKMNVALHNGNRSVLLTGLGNCYRM